MKALEFLPAALIVLTVSLALQSAIFSKLDRMQAQLDGWQPVLEHQKKETQELLNQAPKPKGIQKSWPHP